jgi:hypothetical protein
MIRFNFKDFERVAKRLNAAADQIPFALARSLNDAAETTRKQLIEDWPSHVQARNKSFIKASLTIAGNRATKKNLRVAIIDKLDRGNLVLHADGGTKGARRGRLAVPSRDVKAKRGARGVPKALRPLALADSFKRGDVIFQRVGKGGRRLKLMYTLKSSVRVPKQVPFRETFDAAMKREVFRAFIPRLWQAMATRK